MKEAFVWLYTSDQIKIVTVLKDSEYRRPNLRKLLRLKQPLEENAITIIQAILNIEAVNPSKEFGEVIRETLTCNGYKFDYFQDIFDKRCEADQLTIIGALQYDPKQRLGEVIRNHANLSETMESLIKEILEYRK